MHSLNIRENIYIYERLKRCSNLYVCHEGIVTGRLEMKSGSKENKNYLSVLSN